ncbi:MAG TPA: TonB-dependent receptor [Saprospiraceae bacterium]|nr:TonB-dependent receptor [Saprospiraceae bacterium]
MRVPALLILLNCALYASAQNSLITGSLSDDDGKPVEFASIVLYTPDSIIVKVETTDETGTFTIANVKEGNYFLEATCIGYADFVLPDLAVLTGQDLDLGQLILNIAAIELETAMVSATRAMVEIKPDRTVFNVQGTINSAGDNGLSLLRKAPGVLVDNNNNISVLSRSGVLIYIDGKRLPLSGDNLTNYLENLPAEQIDRIDIISNPGARYEAEGNAGIIDIRLKKDTNHGANGSVSATYSEGQRARGNVNASGNYRNKTLNTFGSLGYNEGIYFNEMFFLSFQNGLELDEIVNSERHSDGIDYRLGTDFFLHDKHTIGFLVTGNNGSGNHASRNRIEIGSESSTMVDSILHATNASVQSVDNGTYNLNYSYQSKATRLNIDADYGRYRNETNHTQPNQYYSPDEQDLLTEIRTAYDTPVEIDIYTFKTDYETETLGGTVGMGMKLSRVSTDNTFLFYDIPESERILNDRRSNQFLYDENVYAGYLSFARSITEKWNFSAGLRLEQTDATGDLMAFLPELQEPPVELNYLNTFPTVGLTYQYKPEHVFALNYGRRINRPDYNVLNPFREQFSELSFSKGNPFLRPEIVNNFELGYTLKYRYNFKLSYSRTLDQITRLIAPDDVDPRAGFITWDNLAVQTIYAANISLPLEINKWWNAYVNLSGTHLDNQADYGGDAIVDVQAWTYNIYQQHTFKLPGQLTGEISGWFSGPGVWGGVFIYETSWSLNLGLQRKFLKDQMNVRLSVNDVFYESGWSGYSRFNGLYAEGRGVWDSRRASLSVSMNFGNKNVKSRNRKTGLEDEAKRIGNSEG